MRNVCGDSYCSHYSHSREQDTSQIVWWAWLRQIFEIQSGNNPGCLLAVHSAQLYYTSRVIRRPFTRQRPRTSKSRTHYAVISQRIGREAYSTWCLINGSLVSFDRAADWRSNSRSIPSLIFSLCSDNTRYFIEFQQKEGDGFQIRIGSIVFMYLSFKSKFFNYPKYIFSAYLQNAFESEGNPNLSRVGPITLQSVTQEGGRNSFVTRDIFLIKK